MKILLLNQVFYPDVVSTAQHLSDLATELAKRGHEVTVISSRRAYEHPDTLFKGREQMVRRRHHPRLFHALRQGGKWRRAADFANFLLDCGVGRVFLSLSWSARL